MNTYYKIISIVVKTPNNKSAFQLSSLFANFAFANRSMIKKCKRIGAVNIEYNQTKVRYKNMSIEKSSIWTLFYTFFACQFCARFVTLSKRKFVITEKEQSIL